MAGTLHKVGDAVAFIERPDGGSSSVRTGVVTKMSPDAWGREALSVKRDDNSTVWFKYDWELMDVQDVER